MIAWVGRRVWRAVRTVIRAVNEAHDGQVYMWECILRANRAAAQTATGPLRWGCLMSAPATWTPPARSSWSRKPVRW